MKHTTILYILTVMQFIFIALLIGAWQSQGDPRPGLMRVGGLEMVDLDGELRLKILAGARTTFVMNHGTGGVRLAIRSWDDGSDILFFDDEGIRGKIECTKQSGFSITAYDDKKPIPVYPPPKNGDDIESTSPAMELQTTRELIGR